MDLSQLKTQVTTMFMMSNRPNQADNPYAAIWIMMYSMMFISFIEWLFRMMPIAGQYIKETATNYLSQKNNITNLVTSIKMDVEEHSVTLLRSFDSSSSNTPVVDKVDSIIEYLTKIDNSRHIKIHNRYMLNTRDIINVTNNIKAKVLGIKFKDNMLESIEIKLYSETLRISQLNAWIDDIYDKYCIEKRNNLGNKRFYFNEHPVEPMKDMPLGNEPANATKYRWETAPKYLIFHMNEFSTSKSLANVFGDHIAELKDRIDLFINHPEWYAKRGIPHSLGILLHGLPGCGKTSTIKAIAKDTNRHIINLALKKYTTQRQLLDLFQSEAIHVITNDGTSQTYNIPLDQRIYVIEDIDCLTDVVKDRTLTDAPVINDNNGLNLSFILNLLDGVLETPGRILIMTTNHVEILDKALIRPGRIDVNIRFGYSNRSLILDMINNFYSISLSIDDIPELLDNKFTPAEVIEALCLSYKDYKQGINILENRAKAKLPPPSPTPEPADDTVNMIADTDIVPNMLTEESQNKKIRFGYYDRQNILETINQMCSEKIKLEDIPEYLDNQFKPDEVLMAVVSSQNNSRKAINHLIEKYNSNLPEVLNRSDIIKLLKAEFGQFNDESLPSDINNIKYYQLKDIIAKSNKDISNIKEQLLEFRNANYGLLTTSQMKAILGVDVSPEFNEKFTLKQIEDIKIHGQSNPEKIKAIMNARLVTYNNVGYPLTSAGTSAGSHTGTSASSTTISQTNTNPKIRIDPNNQAFGTETEQSMSDVSAYATLHMKGHYHTMANTPSDELDKFWNSLN